MIFSVNKPIGIVSYGTKIPKYKIFGKEIASAQGKIDQNLHTALGVESKTVPNIDEDTITLSTAAGLQALERLKLLALKNENIFESVDALFIGSESHPYAVKPSGTVVAQALGISSDSLADSKKTKPLALADLQFACKAGTQAMQISALYVQTGFCKLALGIGTDVAQARPGDVLEYTAGAGSAAFILGSGKNNKILARLVATTSVATDTPDFWRRPYRAYPEHAGRFTVDPGYFAHITMAVEAILKETKLEPKDFDYCVFHTPNAKFPVLIAQKLGFSSKQIDSSLLVKNIGNTYAASSMLSLANTLDIAEPNKKILVVSYGSGSGSDAFIFETTQHLVNARKKWNQSTKIVTKKLSQQAEELTPVSYQEYLVNSAH